MHCCKSTDEPKGNCPATISVVNVSQLAITEVIWYGANHVHPAILIAIRQPISRLGKNNLFFEVTSRKIEFLRGFSRKSRDFGRWKTKHRPKKLSASELFGPCFVFHLPKSRFFEKFQVITRFFETAPQKNMLLDNDLFFSGQESSEMWMVRSEGTACWGDCVKTPFLWKRCIEWKIILVNRMMKTKGQDGRNFSPLWWNVFQPSLRPSPCHSPCPFHNPSLCPSACPSPCSSSSLSPCLSPCLSSCLSPCPSP